MSTKTPLTLSLSKRHGPSPPGTSRELPDFLKRGSVHPEPVEGRDLGAPRARYPGMQIGKGNMRREGVPEPLNGDAMSAREWAVRGWLAMVGRDNGSVSVS